LVEAWSGDWQGRFRRIVQNLGYEDVYSFVMNQPGKPFAVLFRELRKQAPVAEQQFLAFAHLPTTYYIDAERRGLLREAFMEALVRSLRQHMTSGWNYGSRIRERRIDARTDWPIPSVPTATGESHEQWFVLRDTIMRHLETSAIPDTWCPKDRHDALIQEAFRCHWPGTK